MRCVTGILLTVLLFMAGMETAKAATCANDFKTRVAANGNCLVIKVYGETAERTALVIFLHGDKAPIADYMKRQVLPVDHSCVHYCKLKALEICNILNHKGVTNKRCLDKSFDLCLSMLRYGDC